MSTTARIGAAVAGLAVAGVSDMPDFSGDHFTWEGSCWEAVTDPDLDLATMSPNASPAAKEALTARIVQAMSVATKKLVVTEEAILNHATLIGQTVVEDINVQGKLIGRDGVFTGTVDFENVNVTGTQLVNKLGAGSIEASMIKSGSFSGETFVGGTFSGARLDGGEFTLMGAPSQETTTYSQNFSSNADGWVYYVTYNDKRSAHSASGGRSGGCLRQNGVEIYGKNKGYAGGRFYINPIPDSGGFNDVRTVTAWVKASKALDAAYLYVTVDLEAGSSTSLTGPRVSLKASTWTQIRLDLPVGVKPRIVEARFEHGTDPGHLVPQPITTADVYLDDVQIKVPAGVASAAHLYVSSSGSPTFELASTSGEVLASLAAPVGGNARLQFPGSGGAVELSGEGLKNGGTRLAVEPSRVNVGSDFSVKGETNLGRTYMNGYLSFPNPPSTGQQANVYMNPTNGVIARSSSSRRYKRNIEDWEIDTDAVLQLRPRTWQARNPMIGESPSDWFVGMVAEEVHDLGLVDLVGYDEHGAPEAIHYPVVAVAQQAVLQKHEAEITELRERIALLEQNQEPQ